jgi:hypothetical protein
MPTHKPLAHLFCALCCSLLALLASPALAAQLTLSWEKSSSPDAVGSTIHYGTASGSYNTVVDAGDSQEMTISGLEIGQTYYFAAKAYDNSGSESGFDSGDQQSGFSNEISHTVVDSDGDGLSDYEEDSIYSTNATLADTDADGMDDGAEVAHWGDQADTLDTDGDGTINILDADSDDDGYSDGQEIQFGSDPALDDSTVATANDAPTADAGVDQDCSEGTIVTLDASNSNDPDNDISAYQWVQDSGPSVSLENSDAKQATFTAPKVHSGGVSLEFSLTVEDSQGASDNDTCIVNISWDNQSPTAEAGQTQTVSPGAFVSLDGSASSDPDDGIGGYSWSQVDGPSVTLTNDETASPSFTAPDPGPDGDSLTFQLTVTDNHGLQATDTVRVNISSYELAPTAEAGPDQSIEEGSKVYLNAINSTDDSAVVSYAWKQLSGPNVTLSMTNSMNPEFLAPNVEPGGEDIAFELTVTDDANLTDTDSLTIHVQDNGLTMSNDQVPDDALITQDPDSGQKAAVAPEGSATLTKLELKDPDSLGNTKNKPGTFDYSFFDFELDVETGQTVTVSIYFDEPIKPGHVWYKYDTDKGWYKYKNCQISDDRTKVSLTLTDGGAGDDDGLVDGRIKDPSGPAEDTTTASTDSSSSSGGGGGCLMSQNGRPGGEWLLIGLIILLCRVGLGWKDEQEGQREDM